MSNGTSQAGAGLAQGFAGTFMPTLQQATAAAEERGYRQAMFGLETSKLDEQKRATLSAERMRNQEFGLDVKKTDSALATDAAQREQIGTNTALAKENLKNIQDEAPLRAQKRSTEMVTLGLQEKNAPKLADAELKAAQAKADEAGLSAEEKRIYNSNLQAKFISERMLMASQRRQNDADAAAKAAETELNPVRRAALEAQAMEARAKAEEALANVIIGENPELEEYKNDLEFKHKIGEIWGSANAGQFGTDSTRFANLAYNAGSVLGANMTGHLDAATSGRLLRDYVGSATKAAANPDDKGAQAEKLRKEVAIQSAIDEARKARKTDIVPEGPSVKIGDKTIPIPRLDNRYSASSNGGIDRLDRMDRKPRFELGTPEYDKEMDLDKTLQDPQKFMDLYAKAVKAGAVEAGPITQEKIAAIKKWKLDSPVEPQSFNWANAFGGYFTPYVSPDSIKE